MQSRINGNCYDNAALESMFSSLKKEKVRRRIFNNLFGRQGRPVGFCLISTPQVRTNKNSLLRQN